MTIAVLGTLDSKGHEHLFVADLIEKKGHEVILIDLGTGGDPQIAPDITRFEVAESIGLDLQALIDKQDRGECVVAMSKAAPILVSELAREGKIDGVSFLSEAAEAPLWERLQCAPCRWASQSSWSPPWPREIPHITWEPRTSP